MTASFGAMAVLTMRFPFKVDRLSAEWLHGAGMDGHRHGCRQASCARVFRIDNRLQYIRTVSYCTRSRIAITRAELRADPSWGALARGLRHVNEDSPHPAPPAAEQRSATSDNQVAESRLQVADPSPKPSAGERRDGKTP